MEAPSPATGISHLGCWGAGGAGGAGVLGMLGMLGVLGVPWEKCAYPSPLHLRWPMGLVANTEEHRFYKCASWFSSLRNYLASG